MDLLIPIEGQLYKALTVAGHRFELRYGYYEEREREECQPVVIFPDLHAAPRYCPEGYPLVTQIQDPCEHYAPAPGREEPWCGDCAHFHSEHPEIGVCRCETRRNTL